jgi:hypothetical protein
MLGCQLRMDVTSMVVAVAANNVKCLHRFELSGTGFQVFIVYSNSAANFSID